MSCCCCDMLPGDKKKNLVEKKDRIENSLTVKNVSSKTDWSVKKKRTKIN